MYQDRSPRFLGVNSYVKAMNYSSALISSAPTEFSLGTPAAVAASGIQAATNAQAAANTVVAASYTADSPYGRSVTLAISGNPGNAHVVDVYGYDYLGQPMIERFTGASGGTGALYGKKCFYRVTATKIITPSTNAVTFNLGTGWRFGLPYKGDLAYAKENGIQIPIYKRDTTYEVTRPAALAISGGSVIVDAPFPGFVKDLYAFGYGAGGGTNPVITVNLGGTAIGGLTVTPVTASKALVRGTPATVGYRSNNRFRTGDLIEIVGAAAAGAGGDTVGVTLTPTHFSLPDLTDPATATTFEPRGSYEPLMTPDGVSEIRVGLVADNQVNANGNGGLHGIKHFFA